MEGAAASEEVEGEAERAVVTARSRQREQRGALLEAVIARGAKWGIVLMEKKRRGAARVEFHDVRVEKWTEPRARALARTSDLLRAHPATLSP